MHSNLGDPAAPPPVLHIDFPIETTYADASKTVRAAVSSGLITVNAKLILTAGQC